MLEIIANAVREEKKKAEERKENELSLPIDNILFLQNIQYNLKYLSC
jgi:hypothetical protein